jgi:cytidine deaminase
MSAETLETQRIDPLINLARQSREAAYAPYSRFRVGAAVLTRDGRMFGGCNVENAAYGLCNCAERTALFSAVVAGYGPGQFQRMVVIGDTPEPISPCGACRQVLSELCDADMPVLLSNLKGLTQQTSVGALLPGSFALPERGIA